MQLARFRAQTTLALFCMAMGLLIVPVPAAHAHVDLVSSDPVDGALLVHPPEVIELIFNASVALAGEGVHLLDAAGSSLPVDLSQPAEDRLVMAPMEALSDGAYSVSWTVRSGDAHPRSGSLEFAVLVQTAPAAPASDKDASAATRDSADESNVAADQEVSGAAPSARGDATLEFAEVPDEASDAANAAVSVLIDGDEQALAGEGVARFGRWLALLGALVGIGVLAFAATALVGSSREIAEAVFWVRRSAAAVLIGTALEVVGTSMMLSGSLGDALLPSGWLDVLAGPFGVAVALRVAGAIAFFRGAVVAVRPAPGRPRVVSENRGSGDAEPASAHPAALLTDEVMEAQYRMDLSASRLAVVGAIALALSHLFDGHTVTTTPALVVRSAAVAHVVGAAVWVGGVLMLAWLLAGRRRRGLPLRAAHLAVRFSHVAAIALGAVAAAGIALTWAIIDHPQELIATPWGRFLLLKLLLVGLAIGLGGYNHRVVVPRLDADEDVEAAGDLLRRVVRVEGAVLIAVIGVTAALVAAAS